MDFNNPDNRAKVLVFFGAIPVTFWFLAIWTETGKMGWTGALMLIPFVATVIWTCVGYDAETAEDCRERKERKKNKSKVDNSARL